MNRHTTQAGEREARTEGDLPMPEPGPVEENWDAAWSEMAEAQPPAILRQVSWTNLWNRSRAWSGDGHGSMTHLSTEGTTGTTLCGKRYPADKGSSSLACFRLCRRCAAKARAMGTDPKAVTGWVPDRPYDW